MASMMCYECVSLISTKLDITRYSILISNTLGSSHYLHHPGGREKTREGHEHFTFWMGRVMNILNFQQGGSWTFCLMGRVMNFFPRGEGRELHFFPNKSVRNSKIFGAARQYNWQWSMVFNTTCKMVHFAYIFRKFLKVTPPLRQDTSSQHNSLNCNGLWLFLPSSSNKLFIRAFVHFLPKAQFLI